MKHIYKHTSSFLHALHLYGIARIIIVLNWLTSIQKLILFILFSPKSLFAANWLSKRCEDMRGGPGNEMKCNQLLRIGLKFDEQLQGRV